MNAARKFFKHADRDPDEVLTNFTDDRNMAPLLLAGAGLRRVQETNIPLEVGIFEGWLSIIKPELLVMPLTHEASAEFGNDMRSEPRHVQKELGRDALVHLSVRADVWVRRTQRPNGL
jgi:hypothetical protein